MEGNFSNKDNILSISLSAYIALNILLLFVLFFFFLFYLTVHDCMSYFLKVISFWTVNANCIFQNLVPPLLADDANAPGNIVDSWEAFVT